MATKIDDDSMFPEIGDRVIATAEFSGHAAATAHGPSRATRAACSLGTQGTTAMVLAERLAAGYGDDDPFVIGWREELGSSYAVADVTQAGCG